MRSVKGLRRLARSMLISILAAGGARCIGILLGVTCGVVFGVCLALFASPQSAQAAGRPHAPHASHAPNGHTHGATRHNVTTHNVMTHNAAHAVSGAPGQPVAHSGANPPDADSPSQNRGGLASSASQDGAASPDAALANATPRSAISRRTRAHHLRNAPASAMGGSQAARAAIRSGPGSAWANRARSASAPRSRPLEAARTRANATLPHLPPGSSAPSLPAAPSVPTNPDAPEAPGNVPLNAPSGSAPGSLTLGPSTSSAPGLGLDYPFAFLSLAALWLVAWQVRGHSALYSLSGISPHVPHPPG
jgi:hypothetical protein